MPEFGSVRTRINHCWLISFGQVKRAASVALLTFGLGHAALGAEPAATAPPQRISFGELGASALELRGTQPSGGIDIGVRGDEVVAAAKLRLRMTYSPAMLPQLSHLRVSLNNQVLAALPLPSEQAGREIEREVVLDPRYFTDYNQLRFDLIGHYTLECEDPSHTSLWATLSPLSELELTMTPLELRNELALLPAPFFDRRDNRRLTLPVLLPEQPSREIVRSAGVVASWFGSMADYRSARFPVSFTSLPEQHGLVFATNSAKPNSLQLADVTVPTVSIIDHPSLPTAKLLVFQGKDEAQLRQAVEGVVLGSPVLSGAQATVTAVELPKREPYDAPRWVRTNRAVKLGELVDSPQQLQTSGIAPQPIRVNLRLPPDLFTWNQPGVPMDLRYRYSAPNEQDTSSLNISINELLLRSYRLRPEGAEDGARKVLVPLLDSGTVQQSEELRIPAFQLVSNNQLQFRFSLDPQRQGPCSHVPGDQARQGIDPDSSIDFSDFAHYTAMPNLALFANAGYPFTRYADLAETAIVLSDTTQAATLEQLFFLLGRMGRHTGTVALSYQLLNAEQAKQARDLDLLVLSGAGAAPLLSEWEQDLALAINGDERKFRELSVAPRFENPANANREAGNGGRVQINASGSLGAFISFESPLTGDRTVVALAGSDDAAAQALIGTLEDDGKVPLILGDLAIVRGDTVQSYRGDSVYYVGTLSLWKRLWFHLSQHVLLFTLVALTVVVLVAMLLYGGLQRRVARRLAATGSQ
ncbi:cellulose biosynthesis cyclic di-GMP-binding regulatory protein BcsB [Steroidobacter sp.]|uniref:cellulose biosynthesis cyclic di-GMP-binding regulatory protein BcsB n=1 Tax=Steroidobacter sp. TaxID=1978227 RepID=UPI001A6006C4|nr:cellulose biosynthesis cyclic di-GMP-binding regulatory protein BcsB [Steroidobacter sp.]MBL8270097.1 cellulose biosynthesis cyclic di-GMP-binding regulatory protein BcsB [Steroidobacter sp.]